MDAAVRSESDLRIQLHRRLSATYASSGTADRSLWIEPGPVAGSYLLGGELDVAAADQLSRLMPPPGAIDVLLDMSGVTFLDSGGVGAIIALASRIDRDVVIDRPSEPVRAALAITRAGGLPGIVVQEGSAPVGGD